MVTVCAFDDASSEIVSNGNDAGDAEPGCAIQRLPLIARPFPPADRQHHHHVQDFRRRGARVAHRRKNRIDANQPAFALHRRMAVLQQSNAVFVVPIVDDVAEHIGVGPRDCLEHVRSNVFEPGPNARCRHGKARLRHRDQIRHVLQHTPEIGVPVEQRHHQMADPAANVDDFVDRCEIAMLEDSAYRGFAIRFHCLREGFHLVRVRLQVIPPLRSQDLP
jgi:hypothetical protein